MPFKTLFTSAFVIFLALTIACEPEEARVNTSPGLKLHFSTDTVQFDTVFTGGLAQVRNITKRLKIFNPHDRALEISAIALARGNSSPYKLFINGRQAQSVNNEMLLGGDSLLILVNLQINPQDKELPFLVKDSILFEVNGERQEVKLIAHGQDVTFVPKGPLSCDQVWNAGKPYLLKDTVWVEEGCTLTINKGTQLYFNNHAALVIKGTLKMLGDKEERILLSNSRLDIKNEIGLWAGIHFLPQSHDHEIYYATIRNAHTAIFLETHDADTLPDLVLGNTKIENMAGSGIYAHNADLYVYNTLINNALEYIVRNEGGGNYTYEHCTLVNFATLGFFPQQPAVLFSDAASDGEEVSIHPLKVKFYNNIVWSGGSLTYDSDLNFLFEGDETSVDQDYNLIRSIADGPVINHNIISSERNFPEFAGIAQYNYQIDSLSPAIDAGKALGIILDLEGKERDEKPDIGAYEYVKP